MPAKAKAAARLNYPQSAALKTYRFTSRELKRRPLEDIVSDSVIRRSLSIGAISVWCFWIAFAGFISTGTIAIYIGRTKNEVLTTFLGFVIIATLAAVTCAPLVWIVGRVALSFALEARKTTAASNVAQTIAYRDVEQVRAERQGFEKELFNRNLEQRFVLRSLQWNGVRVFDDGVYQFAPRVNVLLGKNGFGKTLLLRTLAALLQRDLDYSGQLFPTPPDANSTARVVANVTRSGSLEQIIRDPVYFEDSVGKIPLLAIPDSRFVNKSVRTVASSRTGTEPLSESGAHHYLTQEPYEDVVLELLSQIGIDYVENGRRGFEQPIFSLIENVVRQLTDDDEFRFASIQRMGRTGFEILVYTSGSRDTPLPIQTASQGTFSVIAIFGLIYSFLRSLTPAKRDDRAVSAQSGIVIIDEIDAHLHPSWQQRIMGILTNRFPNVQFIVSAHSPAIVAGCDFGEVVVLRRDKERDRFRVDPLQRDFLGATAKELYKTVFDIEDTDRLYLEYSTKATIRTSEEREKELDLLESKKKPSAEEEDRLEELEREDRLVRRAEDVRQERLKQEKTAARIALLEEEVKQLRRKLAAAGDQPKREAL